MPNTVDELKPRREIILLFAAMWLVGPSGGDSAFQQVSLPGLESFFETGAVFQDRNGDGDVDYVAAHLTLGRPAADADVAAAANVAARLGFETSAMNLPLTTATEGVAIVIGRAGLARLGIPRQRLGVDLEPGLGVIAWLESGPAGAVAIAGGDEAGTAAAAVAFGARAPYLWSPEGSTLGDVVARVEETLATDGLTPQLTRVTRLIVDSRRLGVSRLDVDLLVAATELARAEAILRRAARQEAGTGAEGDSTEVAADERAAEAVPSLRFDGLRLLRVNLSATGSESVVIHAVGDEDEPAQGSGRRPGGGDKADLNLSNLFSNSGFLSDSDNDLIPDRVDVMLSAAGDVSGATADLAARLALEATGVTIPIAVTPSDIDDPESLPPLVLVGSAHPLVQRLIEEDKISLTDLEPGQGLIRVVPDAFGEKTAVVIAGDEAGVERAVRQVAERLPHVWERGKDRTTLADVEHDTWMALAGRSPVGQAATALYKLDKIVEQLSGMDLESVEVSLHVEKAEDGLADLIRERVSARLPADRLDIIVGNLDVQNAELVIDEEIEIPSEVDEFWDVFRRELLPQVRPGVGTTIDALLSEPPEVRAAIERQAIDELVAAGADAATTSVTVLSAYKQGYSWLYDAVRPALRDMPVDRITIRFAEIGPPEEWPQQAMYTPTRWLLEIFPIDELLARDLDLALDQIQFEKMPIGSPAYEVLATSADGAEVYRESFDPKFVLRPYFERFPDYEMARVTTGWITARVGDRRVVDQRVVTDLERFWDHFQASTLSQIYDYVMRIEEGKPRASDAPHFGELRIDVSLSEPDYQIGVDKEQVASMEALHEEIYFATLHFFDVLGRLARGQALNYPGRVIPIVRPKADGAPGQAKITFTGFGVAGPTVRVAYKERGEPAVTERRDIVPVALDEPTAVGALVRAGQDGIERLAYRAKVDYEQDLRAEFVTRTSARNVDSRMVWGEQISGTLAHVRGLHAAGLYTEDLAYHDLGAMEVASYWGHEFDPDSQTVATLPANGSAAAFPDITGLLPANSGWRDGDLVQWDTPIPPPEAAEILAKMSTYPQANVYQVGESYLGKQIWAMDLTAPVDAAYWSQAKASTLKPTVIYSARQHANEVSSTSHVLKFAELLLTDPEYADALNDVNVVIHPITNPDGAQLAYDLYRITPDHMLHAGYLGSLGVDVSSGQGDDDPIYPETKVRPKLWNTWLPDIFLNPHGYPSHEWVQVFSEYAGWVRSRVTSQRGWWGMRGWFMPGFNYVDSPDFPDHKAAAFEIRDRITHNINALPEITALNRRAYDRYRRYAFAMDPENFKMDFSDSVLIYTAIKGSTGQGGGALSNPRVTIWSGTTEAPDETAHGEWLRLVASAGLAWDKALFAYLFEGNHEVEREETEFAGGVSFKIDRERPPKASDDDEEAN